MIKVGILGYGEIGSSIEKFYLGKGYEVKIKDLDRDDGFDGIAIMNVCIPYNDEFHKTLTHLIKMYKPQLTLIHSTVIPGTTKKLQDQFIDEYVVHTPVRGVHPNLYYGIKTFVKYIGSDTHEGLELAEKHLKDLGIKVEAFKNSTSTELAKILCTTYYGMCIAWTNHISELCKKYDVPFEEVGTKWNTTYNEGFTELGMSNVVRPVLYPPPGKIGGHCVVPNTELLKQIDDSLAYDFILQLK
jgi:UDP-N-acetyl-D-mannosaminuronate dehydrogenase